MFLYTLAKMGPYFKPIQPHLTSSICQRCDIAAEQRVETAECLFKF